MRLLREHGGGGDRSAKVPLSPLAHNQSLKSLFHLQAEEQSLTLAPGERVTLLLRLRARRPGALTLRGLEWTLNGHARGRRLFEPRRARGRRGRCCPWCLIGKFRVCEVFAGRVCADTARGRSMGAHKPCLFYKLSPEAKSMRRREWRQAQHKKHYGWRPTKCPSACRGLAKAPASGSLSFNVLPQAPLLQVSRHPGLPVCDHMSRCSVLHMLPGNIEGACWRAPLLV